MHCYRDRLGYAYLSNIFRKTLKRASKTMSKMTGPHLLKSVIALRLPDLRAMLSLFRRVCREMVLSTLLS